MHNYVVNSSCWPLGESQERSSRSLSRPLDLFREVDHLVLKSKKAAGNSHSGDQQEKNKYIKSASKCLGEEVKERFVQEGFRRNDTK